jgi:hypothetical protein
MGLDSDTALVDLDAAWRERETEALSLAAHFPAASLALRIYSLEIRIKTIICRTLSIVYLPKHCKTHELDELIIFTGLFAELNDPSNAGIRQNWDILVDFAKDRWSKIRYRPASSLLPTELAKCINALDDPRDGVWTWLSKHP